MLVYKSAGQKTRRMERLIFLVRGAEVGELGLKVVKVALFVALGNAGSFEQRLTSPAQAALATGHAAVRALPYRLPASIVANGADRSFAFGSHRYLPRCHGSGRGASGAAAKRTQLLCKNAHSLWTVLEIHSRRS